MNVDFAGKKPSPRESGKAEASLFKRTRLQERSFESWLLAQPARVEMVLRAPVFLPAQGTTK